MAKRELADISPATNAQWIHYVLQLTAANIPLENKEAVSIAGRWCPSLLFPFDHRIEMLLASYHHAADFLSPCQ